MSTLKIKKGDTVQVITGKDKGKEGRVLVEGVNMITKHTKASQTNPKGGIVHQESPIDISNVMYVLNGKATRVGFTTKDSKKVRIAKSTGEIID